MATLAKLPEQQARPRQPKGNGRGDGSEFFEKMSAGGKPWWIEELEELRKKQNPGKYEKQKKPRVHVPGQEPPGHVPDSGPHEDSGKKEKKDKKDEEGENRKKVYEC